jgi:hypothetical protein
MREKRSEPTATKVTKVCLWLRVDRNRHSG